MKEKFARLIKYFVEPKAWLITLIFILTIVFAGGAITLAVTKVQSKIMEILSYVCYAFAGILLSYSVYIIVRKAPKIKQRIVNLITKTQIGSRILSHYGFRTVAFSGLSMAFNILYVIMHVVLAVTLSSFWYGSLALYYGLLVALRSGLVLYHRKKGSLDDQSKTLIERRKYCSCGIILMIIPLCLVVPILQIAFLDKAFVHQGWTIFAFAAYAFYKISMAIVNVYRSKKQSDLTVRALRNVGLADAFVSIFSLQTALLYAFSETADYSIYNIITGTAVCVLTVALGVYMIIKSKNKGLIDNGR